MQIHNRIATDLSSILSKKFDKLTIANEQAMSTIEPESGRIFTLEYAGSGKSYGSVTVNIVDPDTLVVYYNNNITEDMRHGDKKEWYAFLKELRYFAKRNLMGFDVRNIGKQHLDKKDYAYIKVNDKSADIEEVNESKLHGSIKTSYQQIGDVRLIIKHTKPIDEERRGARTRQVHSMYVENSNKERTKIPFNFLSGARALSQHVNQGGELNDEFGQHIHETIQEVVDLKKFIKAFRRVDNFAEQDDAQKIIEQAKDRATGLIATLKTLSGPKGYKSYVHQYEPTESYIDQADYDEIRGKLIRIQKDNIVDSVLPSLARGIKAMDIKEKEQPVPDDQEEFDKEMDAKNLANVQDVIKFAQGNDDIELIDAPEQVAKLKSGIALIQSKKFDKDEEKNKQQKNRNMVMTILDYLEFNVADDAMATGLKKLDYNNKEHSAAAYKLALKYLKGNTKKITKAKKDLYGKDKMEDAQFEDWANNLSEGTWAIPDTVEAVEELTKIMQNPLPVGADGENATGTIYAFIGDDELFDDLGEAGDTDPGMDARPIIQKWVDANIERYDIDPALISRIKDAVKFNEDAPATEDHSKNCGCGKDPCETYGKMEEAEIEEADIEEAHDEAEQINAELDRVLNLAGLTNEYSDAGMNKYGLAAVNKGGKFYSYKDGKETGGPFDTMDELAAHQQELIQSESVGKTAGDDSYYNLQQAKKKAKADGKDPERLSHAELMKYIDSVEEGYYELPKLDTDKYQKRDGLEGPMMTKAGKVLYYDPKEGKHYDPDTDMYMDYEDAKALDEACGLQCKECGDMLGEPTTDCGYDSMDHKGENWIMVDIDGDGDDDIAVKKEDFQEDINRILGLAGLK